MGADLTGLVFACLYGFGVPGMFRGCITYSYLPIDSPLSL